jgi:hypothetical protein
VDIRSDQENTIQRDAAFLTQYPNMNFTIEGNCDERGSIVSVRANTRLTDLIRSQSDFGDA